MSQEILLEELKLSSSIEQKAALVAESIIQDLPSQLGKVAIWCALLPWFSNELIEDMLGSFRNDESLQKIVSLPFVEKLPIGYCFHTITRRGLLKKYQSENPLEIQKAFETAHKVLKSISDSETRHLIDILYGYVITNQGLEAEELLMSMLEQGKIKEVEELSLLDEAEEFSISDGVGLTSNYWFYRGSIYLIEGNSNAATVCANKALILDKNYYHAYLIRGMAQALLGNFDAAFREITIAIQAQPDEMSYRSRAAIYMLKKDYKNSVFDLTRALRINSKDTQAHMGLAEVYFITGKYEKALHELDKAIVLSEGTPTKITIYYSYAKTYTSLKDYEKAIFYLDKIIEFEQLSGIHRRKGSILFGLGRFDEAKKCYEKALELDDENGYAYLGRGKLYLLDGDYTKAIDDFNKALAIKEEPNPFPLNSLDIKEVNLRLWEAYIKLGDTNKAEEQKNIIINRENELELYEALYFCRKYELFEPMLLVGKKLIDHRKVLLPNYMAIGYALNHLGDYANAIGYFEKEESLAFGGAINNINLGISYWGLEKYERAKSHFKAASKVLNKKPPKSNFRSTAKNSEGRFAEKVWLKIIFGDLEGTLHLVDSYLQANDIDINEFYDLRDWGGVIKRFPGSLPEGFDDFYDRLVNVILNLDSKSIYKLNRGI